MATKPVVAASSALETILNDDAKSEALADLRKHLGGFAQKIVEIEEQNAKIGTKIDAWNDLPAGSAPSIGEARELIAHVESELDVVRGFIQKLERAKKAAKKVSGAAVHVDTLYNAVDSWRRDLEADRDALLVASRDVIPEGGPVGANGKGNGTTDIPLPIQVERALADAYKRRDAREDEAMAARMLPSDVERKGVGDKLLASIAEDSRRQIELEKKVQDVIERVRHADAAAPPDLKQAADQLKAWGIALAFEQGRVKQQLSK